MRAPLIAMLGLGVLAATAALWFIDDTATSVGDLPPAASSGRDIREGTILPATGRHPTETAPAEPPVSTALAPRPMRSRSEPKSAGHLRVECAVFGRVTDPEGEPVPGVSVTTNGYYPGAKATDVTDTGGWFELHGLRPVTIKLRAVHTRGPRSRHAFTQVLLVRHERRRIDLVLGGGPGILGELFDVEDNPVADQSVYIRTDTSVHVRLPKLVTNRDGAFFLELWAGADPTSFTVTWALQEPWRSQYEVQPAKTITALPGDQMILRLRPRRSEASQWRGLRVNVAGVSDGIRTADIRVLHQNRALHAETVLVKNGTNEWRCFIPRTNGGPFELMLRSFAGQARVPLTVDQDGWLTGTVRLSAGTLVRGRVTRKPRGEKVEMRVILRYQPLPRGGRAEVLEPAHKLKFNPVLPRRPGAPWTLSASPNPDGTFAFGHVPPGRWYLTWKVNGRGPPGMARGHLLKVEGEEIVAPTLEL